MTGRDDDRFRVKPAAPKSRAGPGSQRFISQVLKQVSKAGAERSGKNIGRPASGWGHAPKPRCGRACCARWTSSGLTSLDRALIRQAGQDSIDLTGSPPDRQRQNVLRARLQRLEGIGLAEQVDANRWKLQPGMVGTLNAMGEREDALDTMRRALEGQQRELVVHDADDANAAPIIGRIAGKGLADELNDRGYLVVDGVDGRTHYLKLRAGEDLSELPMHAIVEAKPPGQEKAVDRNILAASKDGIYSTTRHLAQLRQAGDRDPQAAVDAHVRRLEALRRAGVVERMTDGA